MEFINVKQLLSDYITSTKNLPVTVTRLGKPIFEIWPTGMIGEEARIGKVPERHLNPVEPNKGVDQEMHKIEKTVDKLPNKAVIFNMLKEDPINKNKVIFNSLKETYGVKPLGMCTNVTNGRRCHNQATIERESGNVCEEHK